MHVEARWTGGQRFEVEAAEGSRIAVDGESRDGLSPVETLLSALTTCMGIDVVDILAKGRQNLTGCVVRAEARRRAEPPRRLTAVHLTYVLTGNGLSRDKAERAVELSRSTYCSVWHSLAPDIDLAVEIDVREAAGESRPEGSD